MATANSSVLQYLYQESLNKDKTIEVLQSELNTLTEEICSLRKTIEKLANNYNNSERMNKQLEKSIETLNDVIENLNAELTDTRKKLREAEKYKSHYEDLRDQKY